MKTTDDSICALRKSKPKTSNQYISCVKCNGLTLIDQPTEKVNQMAVTEEKLTTPIKVTSFEPKNDDRSHMYLTKEIVDRLKIASDGSGLTMQFLARCIIMKHLGMVSE